MGLLALCKRFGWAIIFLLFFLWHWYCCVNCCTNQSNYFSNLLSFVKKEWNTCQHGMSAETRFEMIMPPRIWDVWHRIFDTKRARHASGSWVCAHLPGHHCAQPIDKAKSLVWSKRFPGSRKASERAKRQSEEGKLREYFLRNINFALSLFLIKCST